VTTFVWEGTLMPVAKSIERVDRYTVTEKGSHDLRTVATCDCNPKLAGLLIVCDCCGTVYGSVRESMDWGRGTGGFKR
jgi:hypothetical protein